MKISEIKKITADIKSGKYRHPRLSEIVFGYLRSGGVDYAQYFNGQKTWYFESSDGLSFDQFFHAAVAAFESEEESYDSDQEGNVPTWFVGRHGDDQTFSIIEGMGYDSFVGKRFQPSASFDNPDDADRYCDELNECFA